MESRLFEQRQPKKNKMNNKQKKKKTRSDGDQFRSVSDTKCFNLLNTCSLQTVLKSLQMKNGIWRTHVVNIAT